MANQILAKHLCTERVSHFGGFHLSHNVIKTVNQVDTVISTKLPSSGNYVLPKLSPKLAKNI